MFGTTEGKNGVIGMLFCYQNILVSFDPYLSALFFAFHFSCMTCGWTMYQWNAIVTKSETCLGFDVEPIQGTLLDANDDGFRFFIYATHI